MKVPRIFINRPGMALPLVLVLLVFGAVMIGAALYVVENLYSTTKQTVDHAQLYNAAQIGVERGKVALWENRSDLETDTLVFSGNITSIYAQKDDGSSLGPIDFVVDPGIDVEVLVFDCNYELATGSFSGLSDEVREQLPPRFPGGTGEGGGGTSALPGGTSAIIDPGRFLPFGGGAGERRFVIRSSASKDGKDFIIETMVVVRE